MFQVIVTLIFIFGEIPKMKEIGSENIFFHYQSINKPKSRFLSLPYLQDFQDFNIKNKKNVTVNWNICNNFFFTNFTLI